MAFTAPDNQEYFRDNTFSDIDIEIVEDVEPGKKRRGALTIPGHVTPYGVHSMVLIPFSAYCKVKLEHWPSLAHSSDRDAASNNSSCNRVRKKAKTLHMQLPVPPRQTDIAVRLIQAMYQQTASLSDLSQQQLLQLLTLADRCEVPKVLTAALAALEVLSANQMEWITATGLLDLPFSFDEHANFMTVIDTAENKLLQRLGDLEEVWADEQLQDKLLDLPHAAMLRLVQHGQTRVANKRTVVYTILQWWEKQPPSYQASHKQDLCSLCSRSGCSISVHRRVYISIFMTNHASVLLCYDLRELAVACAVASPDRRHALQAAEYSQLKQYPAWTAAKRPPSDRLQEVEWKLPIAELRDAVRTTLSHKQDTWLRGLPTVLQGHKVRLQVKVCTTQVPNDSTNAVLDATNSESDIESAVSLQIGMFLTLQGLKEGAVCTAQCH